MQNNLPQLTTPLPEAWDEKYIDENLNVDFANKFRFADNLLYRPHLVGEVLDFDEVRRSLGYYAWVRGLKGWDEEIVLKRYNFILEVIEHYQEKISGITGNWKDRVLDGVTWRNKSKKAAGYKWSEINENRKREAWEKVTTAIARLIAENPSKTYRFRSSHLKRYGITAKYISKYKNEIETYYFKIQNNKTNNISSNISIVDTFSESSLTNYEKDCLIELQLGMATREEIIAENIITEQRVDILIQYLKDQ